METTNQEIKFFSVEIGIETRRGNFIKHHSFVCKTQLETMGVHMHYVKQYHGFAVNVIQINEIVTLDKEPESKKTEFPTKKVQTFFSVMDFNKFSEKTKNDLMALNETRRSWDEEKKSLEKIVKDEIKQRNNLIDTVNLTKSIPDGFNGRTSVKLPYTANLNGNIVEYTEREIQEDDK